MDQFDAISLLLVTRVVERISVVFAGLAFIYLGYKLFTKGVSGEASLKASKGDGELQLLNAAPGLFFALFGVILVGIVSFNQAVIPFSTSSEVGVDKQIREVLFSSAGANVEDVVPANQPDRITNVDVKRQNLSVIFEATKRMMLEVEFTQRLELLDAYRTAYELFGVEDNSISPTKLPLQD